MAQASKKKKPQAPSQIYVGPNLSGDILVTRFSVFQNGFPPGIKARQEFDPHFKALFVPVSELAPAREQLKTPGSRLAIAFQAVEKTRKGVTHV